MVTSQMGTCTKTAGEFGVALGRKAVLPPNGVENVKATYHSESDQDAIDQLKISGGKGISH